MSNQNMTNPYGAYLILLSFLVQYLILQPPVSRLGKKLSVAGFDLTVSLDVLDIS